MWFGLITIFPEIVAAVTQYGISSRAVKTGAMQVVTFNPRDYVHNVHRTIDDRPYGGGPGMLMLPQPLFDAVEAAKQAADGSAKVIYLSPQGKALTQAKVREIQACERVILLAGRYEGVDERLIAEVVDEEISIGDFVLSGGELPAMIIIDAVARLLPGVLNDAQSAEQDSFENGLLDCPHYTRPEEWKGQRVPDVLQSGNHEHIRRWRLKQALGRTYLRRPELLEQRTLSKEEQTLLNEFIREQESP